MKSLSVPAVPGATTAGTLAARFDGDLELQLHRLSHCLCDPSASAWDGASLWLAFQQRRRQHTKRHARTDPELEPLYL